MWTLPGRQVETGEISLDSLIREAREEGDIDAAMDKPICVSSNTCEYQGYSGYGLVPTKVILSFAQHMHRRRIV